MSKRAEEEAVEYQIKTHGPNVMGGASMLSEEEYMRFNMNLDFKNGYEQAEKDILSKITKEHLDGLKWIERTGITSQPYPYHKYCKELRKTLETLLSDE